MLQLKNFSIHVHSYDHKNYHVLQRNTATRNSRNQQRNKVQDFRDPPAQLVIRCSELGISINDKRNKDIQTNKETAVGKSSGKLNAKKHNWSWKQKSCSMRAAMYL
jgi:hypothetical protein